MGGRRIAALPMYDWPEVRAETDALWAALRQAIAGVTGLEGPPTLSRNAPIERLWDDRDLLFGQTCGAPLIATLGHRVAYVATPVPTAPGCAAGAYSSAIVVRRGGSRRALSDLAGAVAAVNGPDSLSGFWTLASRDLIPGRAVLSGSHRRSAAIVAAGGADFAALDATSFALLARFEPETVAALDILGWSAPAPATPYIAAARFGARAAGLAEAAIQALAAPAVAAAREALCLGGAARLPFSAYERLRPWLDDPRLAAVPFSPDEG